MDGLPNNQIAGESFLKTKLGKITILIGLITISLLTFAILKYLDIISIPQLNLLLNQAQNTVLQPSSQKLTLSCPVSDKDCSSGKLMSFNSNPAFAYNVATKSSILNLVDITKAENIALLDDQKHQQKYLFESFLQNNTCYVISYIFPSDTIFGNVFTFPLNKNSVLATLGTNFIEADNLKVNLILQIQSFPKDPKSECSLATKTVDQYGQYQEITSNMFK